jgi:hypothetical protein
VNGTTRSYGSRRVGIASHAAYVLGIALQPYSHPTPGGTMPTIFGYHDVRDSDHWLASPRREEFFGPLGVTNIRTFVDPQSPTRVGVLMDVADMDALMAAMETEAAAEAMAYDGVLPETLVILVEA